MTVKTRYYNERYSTLTDTLHYLSFFGSGGVDITIDKAPIRNRWGST